MCAAEAAIHCMVVMRGCCCRLVLLAWCELYIVSDRSQDDSPSRVFSPFCIGAGINPCIAAVDV